MVNGFLDINIFFHTSKWEERFKLLKFSKLKTQNKGKKKKKTGVQGQYFALTISKYIFSVQLLKYAIKSNFQNKK